MPGPLEGIRIVDASAVVSAPLATMLLAGQGAEVIKIEPLEGDPARQPLNLRGGMTSLYANNNRSKRGIALDLKSEEGRTIVHDLVRRADVFVQNWRPGAAQRLGLGEDHLRAIKPDLIYASVSGYGDSGPLRNQRVYDPIIQALTGYVAIQQSPEIPISDLVRNIVVDKATALTLAQAITAALFARDRGAGGQSIHVPMIDAGLWFFFPDGGMKHMFLGDGVKNPAALYETYRIWRTADGQLVIFAGSFKEIQIFIEALGHAEWLEEPMFQPRELYKKESAEELGTRIEAALLEQRTADLLEKLQAAEVPAAPVLSIDEVFEHPQIRNNGIVVEEEHPAYGRYRAIRPAARFSATPQNHGRAAPLLGEHGDEVLRELGYDRERIAALREAGKIL